MIECDRCGNPLPSRLVRAYERDGCVVTGGLCGECSSTGAPEVEVDLAYGGDHTDPVELLGLDN